MLDIGKRFGIDRGSISVFLKNNGVRINSDERGKYKHHDNVDESYFEVIDTHEKAWLLGLIAADGNVDDKGGFSISQSGECGLKLITHVKSILKIGNNICTYKTIAQDAHSISVRSKIVANQLAKYNIVPRKSLKYTFPDRLPTKFLNDFIRGYIEGDGCINAYDNGNGCITLSVSFVGTPKFIQYCGKIIPIKYSTLQGCSGSPNVRDIRWTGKRALKLCEWIFENELYLSYKYHNYKKHVDYLRNNPPKYVKYDEMKNKALLLLKNGYSCMEIGRLLKIPFQTIYKWKNKYEDKLH